MNRFRRPGFIVRLVEQRDCCLYSASRTSVVGRAPCAQPRPVLVLAQGVEVGLPLAAEGAGGGFGFGMRFSERGHGAGEPSRGRF